MLLQPTVNVDVILTNPGKYVFVSHYYQPESAGFDVEVDVLASGETYKGLSIL